MSDYRPPIKDMLFVIRDLAGLEHLARLPGFEEATGDLVEAVLDEAAQLAAEVIAPTNQIGDREGTRVEGGAVRVPEAFKSAYHQYIEGGWPAITQSPDHGGQGLPYLVGLAVDEMWQAANLAWSLCPLLTEGAARAIEAHADESLKRTFLEPMVAGRWTGTMNLTEPQAGSDLAAVRCQAVPEGSHYRLTGQKIYITWGDHDMAENVAHLVLARLPDAPEGVRGLSLFLVPRQLVNPDGSLGEQNTVRPVSVEHKLGIHGSPTCVMAFEGALGYLVGVANQGLACMFTMMNHARLGVGLEGVAVAERAYQRARQYALERVQGRPPGSGGRATIIEHPDVRRMLLTMKAYIEAMRASAYVTGAHLDMAARSPDPAARAHHQGRVDLMTPVIKGWCTEIGQQLTSLGVQVHGGMGYVEETGAAQHLRDARITTIYEGTTGIQANDLVGRKILKDRGRAAAVLVSEIAETESALAGDNDALVVIRTALADGRECLVQGLRWLEQNHASDPSVPGSVAYHLLMLTGTVTGGWQLARAAKIAAARLAEGTDDRDFYAAKLITARFYAEQIMPLARAHLRAIEAGAGTLMALSAEQF